jgi:phosphatidate phosphatase PAH1
MGLLFNNSFVQGQALDVILVHNNKDQFACNEFNVSFPQKGLVRIHLNGVYVEGLDMESTTAKKMCRFVHSVPNDTKKPEALQPLLDKLATSMHTSSSTSSSNQQEQQKSHSLCFHLVDSSSGVVRGTAYANMFVWKSCDRLIVCDIDGTITKSNVRGAWDTILTESYRHVHDGVTTFLQQLLLMGDDRQHVHHVIYVTSRPMSLATTTRKFLQNLQQDATKLPAGPLFCNLRDMGSVLASELLWKDIHHHKLNMLTNQIVVPYNQVAVDVSSATTATPPLLFVAGFGNAITDTMTYNMAGIPKPRIYQINKQGKITCFDRTNDLYLLQQQHTTKRQHTSCYSPFEGTIFQGYTDPNLLEDVQSKLLNRR